MIAVIGLGVLLANPTPERVDALAAQLRDPARAEAALGELVAIGEPAIDSLAEDALFARDLAVRGWAIAGLAEIGGPRASVTLALILENPATPALVRVWAGAARIASAQDLEALTAIAPSAGDAAALSRPLAKRVAELAAVADGRTRTEALLRLSYDRPELRGVLGPSVFELGPKALTGELLHATDPEVRWEAAAYLGAFAGRSDVPAVLSSALRFVPSATAVPWESGPLYVPSLAWWTEDEAFRLAAALVAWDLWCTRRVSTDANRARLVAKIPIEIPDGDREQARRAIDTALREPGLRLDAPRIDGPDGWAVTLVRAAGAERAKRLLREQGVPFDERWTKIRDPVEDPE